MTVIEAIARMEGFGVPGALPTINHSPGDLIYGPEAVSFGAIAQHGRFAVFPDDETGWNALRRWLSVPAKFDAKGNLVGGYLGATIEQAINRFAPPSDGNKTSVYVSNVFSWCNLQPSSILTKELLG